MPFSDHHQYDSVNEPLVVFSFKKDYTANPQKNWRQKDVVLFLVTTLASRGQTKKVK
jgi:hypothetical protein